MFPKDITKLISTTGIIVSMETILLFKENNKKIQQRTHGNIKKAIAG